MPLFQESAVRARAQRAATPMRSAFSALNEHVKSQESARGHDIFFSHSYEDRELILGTVLLIEDLNYTVYLDWRDDPQLDRSQVTSSTAEKLKSRLRTSRCLLYSTTDNAKDSLWMKWELGLKDGIDGKTAILPIVGRYTFEFPGQEFLGLYPYVSIGEARGTSTKKLWIYESPESHQPFDSWLVSK